MSLTDKQKDILVRAGIDVSNKPDMTALLGIRVRVVDGIEENSVFIINEDALRPRLTDLLRYMPEPVPDMGYEQWLRRQMYGDWSFEPPTYGPHLSELLPRYDDLRIDYLAGL